MAATPRNTYSGGCHCGKLKIEYRIALPLDEWPLRACQCSFCRKHGVVTTSHPDGEIHLDLADPAAHGIYRFGLGVTDFHFCRLCGVYVAASSRWEERDYAVLVANSLDCRVQLTQAVQPVVYDDESTESRLSRRAERWAKLV